MKSRFAVVAFTVAVVAFLLGQSFAQEEKPGGPMAKPAWTNQGPEHENLKKTVGEWDVSAQMWMAPGAPPMEFKATAVRTSILGGNYVLEKFQCNFMGNAFEGMLILGYDTLAKQYVSVWIDNMGPIPGINRGVEKDGVLSLEGHEAHWSGKMVKNRSVIESKSDDEVHFANYIVGDDGKETVHMKMVYKRKNDKTEK